MTGETRTFPLEYVVELTGAPSEDWLRRLLNRGEIAGRKFGKVWRMTESDIAALVEYAARPARPTAPQPAAQAIPAPPRVGSTGSGLTPRGRARLRRQATARSA